MLTALLGAGWLLREPARKTYQLGPALLHLGAGRLGPVSGPGV